MLRPAGAADIPAMRAIFDAPGNLDKLEGYSAAQIEAALTDPGHLLFVWENAGVLAGFIWLTGLDAPDGRAKIEEFAAARPGAGLGKRLLEAALARPELDGKAIWLKVAADNAGAIRFYERFGFVLTGIEPGVWHRRSGDIADAATMVYDRGH